MRKGFTLVELSIVLVIVGILIGGILVGQNMIESAKLKNLQRDIVSLEVNTTQFYQKYKRLPGESRGFPFVGNVADERIGEREYRQSFRQLAYAGMISEKYKTIDISITGYDFTTPHNAKTTMMPTSFNDVGINYGYTLWTGIVASDCITGSDMKRGNYFYISKVDPTTVDSRLHTGHSSPRAFISRSDYLGLDKKMDDGNGRNGKLWAYGDGGEFATNYACTRGYNNCTSADNLWNTTGFQSITYTGYDGTIPTCGILYWYNYK